MFNDLKVKNSSIIISYFHLRQLIGVLGMLLPIICIGGGYFFAELPIQRSISFYYHTNMRDFFVGLMVCVSLFLITYKGYDKRDQIVTTISGIAGFGIAFFPCLKCPKEILPIGIFQWSPSFSNKIHITSALIFFTLLGFNSMLLFTLNQTGWKKRVYQWCGGIILGCIVSLSILTLTVNNDYLDEHCVILFFETIMLFSFGFSWWVKGKALEALVALSALVKERTLSYLSGLARRLK
jgi:hypothetical protein